MFNKYHLICKSDSIELQTCQFDDRMLSTIEPIFTVLETPFVVEIGDESKHIVVQLLRTHANNIIHYYVIVSFGLLINLDIYFQQQTPSIIINKNTNTYSSVDTNEIYTHEKHDPVSKYELFYLQKLICNVEDNIEEYIMQFLTCYFNLLCNRGDVDVDVQQDIQNNLSNAIIINKEVKSHIDDVYNIYDVFSTVSTYAQDVSYNMSNDDTQHQKRMRCESF